MDVWPGQPFPLGATYDGSGTNFSLFSEVAEQVELCLFDEHGNEKRVNLPEVTAACWHGYLAGVGPGQRYGFRVHGSWEPKAGHHANPAKLLLDPYAKSVWGDVVANPALIAHQSGDPSVRNELDSAPFVPKSVVVDPWFDWGGERRPGTGAAETIIYEAHVPAFTAQHPAVPEELRGTYAGLAHPAVVDHLSRLGVTAVELSPVHQFAAGSTRRKRGAGRSRHHDPIGFFAPHNGYGAWRDAGQPIQEFRHMVKALHEAGIEVILDVVYHRTAESGDQGQVLSFRGIDNVAYYGAGDATSPARNSGARLNLRHPAVLRLVMDSLRYWVENLHVDGFCFRPAGELADRYHEADGPGAFFGVLGQDPVLSSVKLIADPGDGDRGGGDRGGGPPERLPPGWSQWNHRYRSFAAGYWQDRTVALPELALRLAGSPDVHGGSGRRPYASVNFVAAHGEMAHRSLLALLLLSQGIPMVSSGDELGLGAGSKTAGEDGEAAPIDWQAADEPTVQFSRRLVAVRRQHPLFRRRDSFADRPLHGPACPDFTWFRPDGTEIADGDWAEADAATVAVFLDGEAISTLGPRGGRIVDNSFLLLLNTSPGPVSFRIPTGPWGRRFGLVFDTGIPEDEEGACSYKSGDAVLVDGGSVVLLRLRGPRGRRH